MPAFRIRHASLAIAALLACSVAVQAGTLVLKQVAEVKLPGNPTRLDYQSLDAQKHLLFIAHLVDNEVIVFDTKARRSVTTIRNVARVHGVLAVPELNTVYASATGTNELVSIDERSLRITGRSAAGVYPDGIAYDPNTRHLFVSDEHGKTDTVIDAKTFKRIATIELGAEAGNSQYDPRSHHIFVAVHSGDLIEIDPATNGIVRRIPLPGCEGSHGLLIDAATARAFVACADVARLVALHMPQMQPIANVPVGDDPDVLALDSKSKRLYVAAESGILAIVDDGPTVSLVDRGFFADYAHTVAYDPIYHVLYFPIEYGPDPTLLIVEPRSPR